MWVLLESTSCVKAKDPVLPNSSPQSFLVTVELCLPAYCCCYSCCQTVSVLRVTMHVCTTSDITQKASRNLQQTTGLTENRDAASAFPGGLYLWSPPVSR